MNKITYDIFKSYSSMQKNTSISPLSLMLLFNLFLEGTKEETYEEFKHLINNGRTYNGPIIDLLMTIKKNFEKGNLTITNRIEHSNFLEIKPEFLANLSNELKPEISKLESKVKNLHFIVRNKISIKELWFGTFEDIKGKTDIFTLEDGSEVESQFMFQANIRGSNNIEYFRNEMFRAIKIPLEDKNISFEILLPTQDNGIKNLINNLNFSKLSDLIDQYHKIEGIEVFIPKFNFENILSLKDISRILRDQRIFKASWDFDKMFKSSEVVFIKDILQQNSIKVDLEGIEATGESIAYGGIGSLNREPIDYTLFEANHPFIFLVRELETNTILQLGKFSVPNEVSDSDKFLQDHQKTILRKKYAVIRELKTEALSLSLRRIVYLGLICLNKVITKYNYSPKALNPWFKDLINLLTKKLPNGQEIIILNFWSHEAQTGYPYNSKYLLEKDYIYFQKTYPKINPIVESLCNLISYFAYLMEEDRVYYKFYALRSFDSFLSELADNDLELPNLNLFEKYKTTSEDPIGEVIQIDFSLIDKLIRK